MTVDDDLDGLPLRGFRIVDLADGKAEMCGRVLADLGADVIRIEPPGGSRSRAAAPLEGSDSLVFHAQNANKRLFTVDWHVAAGREQLLTLLGEADVLIESMAPGKLVAAGLSADVMQARNPALIITSVTDFGQTGPYCHWVATDWTHMGLNSVLSRSGTPGDAPLMPPGRLADETASIQAAWATLVALWARQPTARGEHIDVSILEATLQTMDPAFGIAGSATGGVPASDLPTGRPDARHMYPIFACADGHVRICVLAKRQWRAMFGWLGEPREFAGPEFETNFARFAARATLYPLIAELFRDALRSELVTIGQRLGIPIESVQTADEALTYAHFEQRSAWIDVTLPGGARAKMPHGLVEIDGARVGVRELARPVETATMWRDERVQLVPVNAPTDGATGPLSGLRVLDLGVIVVGGETGRLFADLGADVIKVESREFPDGSRQSFAATDISASFAWGHRNKRSLGLDLRNPDGRQMFLELVSCSDVVVSNFKPGTLQSLGLDDAVLRTANPEIITVDSSAMGSSGPESRRMGYGPLVRAVTGLTSLWRYPEREDGFCDSITVYPDHTAARVGAIGALAKLLHIRAGGHGGVVSVAQAETMLTQFSPEFMRESLHRGTLIARGNVGEFDAPYGVFPCAGDDEWAVVTVRGDGDWTRLCAAIGADDLAAEPDLASANGRVVHRALVDARVRAWTLRRTPHQVMHALQNAGVPAAAMNRVNDLLVDEHLLAREFYVTMHQPQIGDIPTESGPARFSHLPGAFHRPAPLQGEQTRFIAKELLALSDLDIERLVDKGILQVPAEPAEPR